MDTFYNHPSIVDLSQWGHLSSIDQYHSIPMKETIHHKILISKLGIFFAAGPLLRAAHHQKLHDWQDLDVVAALAGHQAQAEEHQVRRDQGLVGGQDGRGREEEGAGEAGQAEGCGCQRTGGRVTLLEAETNHNCST